MNERTFYVGITKVDDEQRMVWGYASTTDLDSQGERIALSAMENALPNYMRFANVREMHRPSAVGRTMAATVDDKGMYIGAHVVDDVAWKKVKERVYNGFSVGGNITEKVGDEIRGLDLIEISLVDRPANPSAVFDVWKFGDGRGDRSMGFNLKKWGGAENASEDDVAKILDGQKGQVETLTTEKRVLAEEVTSLKKQVAESKSGSAEAIALQAKVEQLETEKRDREEKDAAAAMKKLMDGAIAAGKFKPEKRPKWEETFKKVGEKLCGELIKDLPAVVPIGERVGSGGGTEKSASDQFDELADVIAAELAKKDSLQIEQCYDRAYKIASQRNPALAKARDQEQLALNAGVGNLGLGALPGE